MSYLQRSRSNDTNQRANVRRQDALREQSDVLRASHLKQNVKKGTQEYIREKTMQRRVTAIPALSRPWERELLSPAVAPPVHPSDGLIGQQRMAEPKGKITEKVRKGVKELEKVEVNRVALNLLKQGAQAWNYWRKQHPDFQPDLSGQDLSGYRLTDFNFTGAKLRGTILSGADLSGAILKRADLSGAVLARATLNEADLTEAIMLEKADLTGAKLVEAILKGADLREAILKQADLSKADLSDAILRDSDLSDAIIKKKTNLSGADLTWATFKETNLKQAILQKASSRHSIPN